MKKCRNCLLPEAAPGADLDKFGVCRLCREWSGMDREKDEQAREAHLADLEQALTDCQGKAEYDCVVPFSGGKDSVYLLYKLKVEYGLNPLAFTTDANIPPLAWQNIKRTLSRLDIDHATFRPSVEFYRKLFRYLLQNQEERGAVYTVSYVYAPLFEGDAIRLAMDRNIPLVLAGYSPGQPEPERMLYEFSRKLMCETDWTPPELRSCGHFTETELSRFFNPLGLPAGRTIPRYLAPFHAWPYDQEQTITQVVKKGLVASNKHASPIFSNYPINWLLMYSDLKSFGYNPYAPEFCTLIRDGKARRGYWRIMAPVVDLMIRSRVFLGREVTRQLKLLRLDIDDLKITRPRGAYDPLVAS